MLGFDCNTPLSFDTAKAFKADGYEFVFRYVGRLVMKPHDLSKIELQNILAARLKLGIVQHVAIKWKPSIDLGKTYGANAARFAKELGYAAGCGIYLDLEDVRPGTPVVDIIDYCNAWYDQVHAAGFEPGIYIGFNSFLTGAQLYHNLKFKHYWKSMSKVPDVKIRGYEMTQGRQITAHGILIDPDDCHGDRLGNKPVFMSAFGECPGPDKCPYK